MATINFFNDIGRLEEWLGLPPGVIPRFHNGEEHWVFVLKVAATVESVLKSAIIKKMAPEPTRQGGLGGLGGIVVESKEDPPYRETVMRLPLQGPAPSALNLGKKYGLIDGADENFVTALGDIRNRYAHSILHHSKSVTELLSLQADGASTKLARLAYQNTDLDFEEDGIDRVEFGFWTFLARMAGRLQPLPAPPSPLQQLLSIPGNHDVDSASVVAEGDCGEDLHAS